MTEEYVKENWNQHLDEEYLMKLAQISTIKRSLFQKDIDKLNGITSIP